MKKVSNIQWPLDFMYDSLYYGKHFRTLNIIDKYLSIEVDTSLLAKRIIRVLECLKTERGLLKQIREDN